MAKGFETSQKLTIIGFFISVFVVGLDSFIISPMLPTIAKALSSSVASVGYGVTIYAIFYAIGAPLIAPFSERFSRKKMIAIGLSIFIIGTFLCGFAYNLNTFYLYRAIAGLGAALFTPNVYAYIGGNFDRSNIGKVMGIVMSALSLSIAIGVPIGSFIAGILSWNWTFYSSSICALIALFLILIFVKKDKVNTAHISSNPFIHYINVFSNAKAVLGLITILFWMYSFYAIYTFLGTIISNEYHLKIESIGIVFIAYGLSNFASSFFGGWIGKALGMRKTILVSGILSCIPYLLFGIKGIGLTFFIICLIVLAFSQGVGVPQLVTFNTIVLPESRATMTSLNSSFLYLGLTLGSGIGGIILEKSSFLLLGITAIITTILAIIISLANIKKESAKK